MRYRIGDHVLDTDRFELTRAGEQVHVEPQVFLVLAHLVDNRHRMVPKEELLDEVWGTRFVTDSALTSRIKSARRAIDDDGRAQDRIRTVRGQGFRFVGPVVVDDAPDRARPVVAADQPGGHAPGSRLPRFDSVLRGRDDELAELAALLERHVVLTLVGPGGIGKTRLAVDVAQRGAPDLPVAFVDLAAVGAPAAVPEQLAATLGIQTGQREAVLTACCEYLSAVPHLLVIDNCEHVIDGAAGAVALVADRSRRSRLLCTSREPLKVPDEQVFRVGPLPTLPTDAPATAESVLATASGSVFVERARRGDHHFRFTDDDAADVARLCRELDGLPLAIELAAGRLAALSVGDLLDRLDRRLDLLGSSGRSVGERHRTLRATITWSYDSIGDDAQRLLRYLAVHPAGATLEVAEAIAADLELGADPLDLVTSLVDASLLQRHDAAQGVRYVQLESLRAFGFDRLDHHGERVHAFDLAAAWALRLVRRMNAELLTPAEPQWADRMRSELPNLRAARQHLVGRGRLDDLVELSCNLHEWARLRDVAEPWSWADELLTDLAGRDDVASARTHAVAAQGAWRRGDIERARALAVHALELERRHPDPWTRARAKSELAVAALFAGDVAGAIGNWLERVALDPYPVDLANAGFATAYAGDLRRAREHTAAARQLASGCGSPTCLAWTAYATGEVEHVAGSGRHVAWLERAVESAATVGSDFTLGVAQVTLATSQAESGDVTGAAGTYHHLIDHWLRSGTWTQLWTTLRNAAALLEEHAPEVALSVVVGADVDPFSPALAADAAERCEALRRRLVVAVGEARAVELDELARSAPRIELARATREALEALIDPSSREAAGVGRGANAAAATGRSEQVSS